MKPCRKMEAKMSRLFDSVTYFLNPGKNLPWTNRDVIHGCEKEVEETESTGSDEQKKNSLLRLSWALVHSTQLEDVQRGKAMLEASLSDDASPSQVKEKKYLLAVSYYRIGEYSRSLQLVEQCLEIETDWNQALALKETIEVQVKKDSVIGIAITATAIGLIVGGIVGAAFSRRKPC